MLHSEICLLLIQGTKSKHLKKEAVSLQNSLIRESEWCKVDEFSRALTIAETQFNLWGCITET